MTIDEAIQNLTDTLNDPKRTYHEDDADALKLGIEALKRLEHIRQSQVFVSPYSPLPGETKD